MLRGPSIVQSCIFLCSKRHSLQMNSFTSLYLSVRADTRRTSFPFVQRTTLPEHFGQVRCASTGLVNHTRLLNRKVLSVRAPTGHTSIMLPEKSLSIAFSMYVLISA